MGGVMNLELNWTNILRGAKVIALVGFLLPWLVVSCQGTEVTSATGMDLALGRIDAPHGQDDGGVAWWALVGLLLTIGGLAATFLIKETLKAGRIAGACAAAAVVIIFAGMSMGVTDARGRLNAPTGASEMERQMSQAMGQAIRVETRLGYWLTLLALAGAAGAGFMIHTGRPAPNLPRVKVESSPAE